MAAEGEGVIATTRPRRKTSNNSNEKSNNSSSPARDSTVDDKNDASTTPPAKKQRLARWDDWVRPQPLTDDLRGDLLDFGLDEDKVQSMLNQPQRFFDPWKDTRTKEYRLQEQKLTKERLQLAAKRRKTIEKYEPLFLNEATSKLPRPQSILSLDADKHVSAEWALFDPTFHEYPLSKGDMAPSPFTRFERFEPGYIRIVEIHHVSGSVRVRSTPRSLQGMRIVYEPTGPRIVHYEAEAAAPDAEIEAPLKPPVRRRKRGTPIFRFPAVATAQQPARRSSARSPIPSAKSSVRSISAPKTRKPERGSDSPALARPTNRPLEAPKTRKPEIKREDEVEDSDSDLTELEDD